jgi:uncharacterized RDD family membrane protein YckC
MPTLLVPRFSFRARLTAGVRPCNTQPAEDRMSGDTKYAGFWPRLVATIVDSIWLYGIIYTILWLLIGLGLFGPESTFTPTRFVFEWVLPAIVVMAFWVTKSATPGKMLFKMRIVDAETYQPVSAPRLFLRYVAYFVSMLPLCLGFLWVAWDKKKQGWHDKIAKTIIVRGN